MARMLGKVKKPMLCPYGCCWSWKHYYRRAVKVNRAIENREWKKEFNML